MAYILMIDMSCHPVTYIERWAVASGGEGAITTYCRHALLETYPALCFTETSSTESELVNFYD